MEFLRHRILHLTACIILALIGFIPASGQVKDRVIEWPTYPLGRINSATPGGVQLSVTEAIGIVDVKVAGRSITIGQPFPADDDWLRSLTLRVRNISGQPIVGARIGFGLRETIVDGKGLSFSLEYGKGLSTGIPSDEQKIIMPDEEFKLKFNEAQYQAHRRFVTERSSLSSFSKVWIGVMTVIFEDGSVWGSGCLPSSNPNNSCTSRAP